MVHFSATALRVLIWECPQHLDPLSEKEKKKQGDEDYKDMNLLPLRVQNLDWRRHLPTATSLRGVSRYLGIRG